MKRILSFFIVQIVITIPLYSQYLVNGRVLNLPDKRPIAFANIGIINSSVGTISNEDGSFMLSIPRKHNNDTVIFSALGFGRMNIPVSVLSEEDFLTIYLKETPKELKTVTVKGESWKRKNYRISSRNVDGSCLYADTVSAGSAMALLIDIDALNRKKQFGFPLYVKKVQLMISNNTFGEFKVRTRLYEVETKTELPGNDILNESVVIRSRLENGLLEIDLSKYNIEIYGNFYLGFEWILDKYDRQNLFQKYDGFKREHPELIKTSYVKIDGEKVPYTNYMGNLYAGPSFGISVSPRSLKNHMCFHRFNSFGRWYRSPSILAAGVVFSNKFLSREHIASGRKIDKKEEIEELLPYYKIERRPFDYRNDEFILQLNESDTGFFRQKMLDAVIIEVIRKENKLSFYAKNRSYYPYQLELNFSKIRNLKPIIEKKYYIVYPGNKKLLEFNVFDPSISNYHYELSAKEIIGDPEDIPDLAFPYLIPIGNKRTVKVKNNSVAKSNRYKNLFILNTNDTVYAMRKGVITGTPVMSRESDKISILKTLEIRHKDGTVMVYNNLNPDKIFHKEGNVVFPGQPLGVINSTGNLRVELYQIVQNGKLRRLDIHYYSGEEKNYLYEEIANGHIVNYADSILIKELTDKK